jgi:hypothetical protein
LWNNRIAVKLGGILEYPNFFFEENERTMIYPSKDEAQT